MNSFKHETDRLSNGWRWKTRSPQEHEVAVALGDAAQKTARTAGARQQPVVQFDDQQREQVHPGGVARKQFGLAALARIDEGGLAVGRADRRRPRSGCSASAGNAAPSVYFGHSTIWVQRNSAIL